MVCPHKACEREMVVQLPMNSSHLKISRPSFTLVQATPPKQISVPQNIVASTPMSQGLHVAVRRPNHCVYQRLIFGTGP